MAQVLPAGDFEGAELAEMGGDPLGVEEGVAAFAQALDQGVERDLRGVGFAMEHGLAEEGARHARPRRNGRSRAGEARNSSR